MTLTKTQRRRLVALSSIVGIMIGIGITVAAGGTLFYTFQSQTDPFTTSSSLEVRNLNAVLNGDTLKLTATVKNSGQTSITAIFIDSISVSKVKIGQNGDDKNVLNVAVGNTGKNFCKAAVTSLCTAIVRADGFSLNEGGGTVIPDGTTSSTLEGGRSNALVMEVKSDANPPLGTNINISDKLNLVLRFTSGQDELLTDVFTTRVKPG